MSAVVDLQEKRFVQMVRKRTRRVDQYLKELDALGVLEPQQRDAAERALKRLRQAQRTGGRREVAEAVDEFARVFVRVTLKIAEDRFNDETNAQRRVSTFKLGEAGLD